MFPAHVNILLFLTLIYHFPAITWNHSALAPGWAAFVLCLKSILSIIYAQKQELRLPYTYMQGDKVMDKKLQQREKHNMNCVAVPLPLMYSWHHLLNSQGMRVQSISKLLWINQWDIGGYLLKICRNKNNSNYSCSWGLFEPGNNKCRRQHLTICFFRSLF